MSAMATEGVFVREWRDPGYETFVRITVGLPEENDRALAALARAGGGATPMSINSTLRTDIGPRRAGQALRTHPAARIRRTKARTASSQFRLR
jgi:hypothetical protein